MFDGVGIHIPVTKYGINYGIPELGGVGASKMMLLGGSSYKSF